MSGNNDVYEDIKKRNRINLLIWLAVIAGFAVYSLFFAGNRSESLEYRETQLVLTVPGADAPYEITAEYEKIRRVETIREDAQLDLGEMMDGVQEKRRWYGVWKNDTFGEYTLYIDPKLKTYMVVTMTDGVLVLNLEGEKTTESLSETLIRLLTENGYWPDEAGA